MKKQSINKLCVLASLVAMVSMSIVAQSATVAYWRFEAGPAGTNVIHTGTTGVYYPDIVDVSGHGNHLSVWQTGSAAGFSYRNLVSTPTILQTGAANAMSVKNTGGYPAMWCATPEMRTIEPKAFTIEATFKAQQDSGHRTIVGRDSRGSVTTGNADLAAVYFQTVPDRGLAIKFCDVQGYWHEAISATQVYTGFNNSSDPEGTSAPWYSMAAVSDGDTLSLYLKNLTAGTDYVLIAGPVDMTTNESNTDRSLTKGTGDGSDWDAGDWTVGRGLYAGGHGDRFLGYIDEVRISDTALKVSQFLHSQAPVVAVFPKQDHFLTSVNPISYEWSGHVQTEGFFDSYTFYVGAELTEMEAAVPSTYLHKKVITDINTTTVSDYAGTYAFAEDYFWRVDVTTYEPNYADPNETVIDIKTVTQGLPIRFFGPKACPDLTISGNVSNLPDPITHIYTPINAVFTVTIDKGPIDNASIKWYKVVGVQDNLVNPDPNDPLDVQITAASGIYEILPLPANVATATQTSLTLPAAEPARNGAYYARVKLVDPAGLGQGCEDNSPTANLFVRDNTNAATNYLVHRYGFDSDAADSIGSAHGTVVDLNTSNHQFVDGQLVLSNNNLNSRPIETDENGDKLLEQEGAYVDLPNGLISPLGKAATFMAWFTYTPVSGDNWPRIFDFGTSTGGEGFSTGADGVKWINGAPYVDTAAADLHEYIMLSPQQGSGPAWRYESQVRPPSNSVYVDPADNTAIKNVEVCVACVFDSASGVSTVYVNGEQVLQSANTAHDLSNINDVNNWLGRSQWPDAMFTGKFNEFRIYDIPLSKYWIKAYYQQGPDNYTATPNPCIQDEANSMDFNEDCVVDIKDFAEFANEWLECDRLYGCL
jgi:hypothetical protein